jgi:hypothetical protein
VQRQPRCALARLNFPSGTTLDGTAAPSVGQSLGRGRTAPTGSPYEPLDTVCAGTHALSAAEECVRGQCRLPDGVHWPARYSAAFARSVIFCTTAVLALA